MRIPRPPRQERPRGWAKVSLALAKGRRKADQRQVIKDRDWQRQKSRLLRTSR